MSRKFITERELAFIDRINKELIQGVVEEKIRYYAISLERSQVNHLYEEAIKKVWAPAVECTALVMYDQQSTRMSHFQPDSQYSLEVYFHKQELTERNVSVREGDFVEYGGIFFEITSATQPQLVFGQVNNKLMIKCSCVPAREGQFAAGSDSDVGRRNEMVVENVRDSNANTISNDPAGAVNPFRLYPSGSI